MLLASCQRLRQVLPVVLKGGSPGVGQVIECVWDAVNEGFFHSDLAGLFQPLHMRGEIVAHQACLALEKDKVRTFDQVERFFLAPFFRS